MEMTTFQCYVKTYYTYSNKNLKGELLDEMLYGYGEIDGPYCADIKFADYNQFVKYCKFSGVYMTKKGICRFKKPKN